MNRILLCLLLLFSVASDTLRGQEPAQPPGDEAAIRKAGEAYVNAFSNRDGKALADLWSPEAVYTNRLTGEEVVGRMAITEQFTELFKQQPELKLAIATESIQFLSPNVGVEHGTATFLAPKAEPAQVQYTAVYVKHDGTWLLDRVTDESQEAIPSHYEQLKSLEWMVGRWVDQDESIRIETGCNWTKNQNFLVRSFTMAAADRIDMAGMQVIGWDPAAKTIRSWTFDSDGGFAEAVWTQKKDRWYVHNKGVLTDGRKATMVNIITPVNENSFTWQTIERTVAGELLPNIDEVEIVRQ